MVFFANSKASLGNAFDEEQWWLTRYKEVKRRVSKWNGLAKLSLTGRRNSFFLEHDVR